MARKPISKRLRFAVFKRDGFRCRYCGSTPEVSVLHVDHVVPVSNGGTNDPANLVAACSSCNGGKSNIPLDKQDLLPHADTETLAEQARQIRGYLASVREVESARSEIVNTLILMWTERIGPMSNDMGTRLRSLVGTVPVETLRYAICAVGKSKMADPGSAYSWERALQQQKYFSGVLRQLREGAKG